MKKLALICVLLSPFLVCDPQSGVDYYTVAGLPASVVSGNVAVDSTGTYGFKVDMSALPAGSYSVTAKACSSIWGCSADSSPFAFTRPSSVSAPSKARLSAQ